MERQGAVRNAEALEAQQETEKAQGRFRVIDYIEDYAPSWSNTFQARTRLLWEVIEGDKLGKNESNWAQCCYVLERRKVKGHLGHNKEAVVPIGRLLAQERIQNEAQLSDYLMRTLPFNEHRHQRLPQVNMKHQLKTEEVIAVDAPKDSTCRCRSEQVLSDILGLEAQLDETKAKNMQLCSQMEALEARLEVLEAYQAQQKMITTMDEVLDKVRGQLAVCLLQNEEQPHKFALAEEARQQASMKQIEHSFKLQSMLEKLADRIEHLEAQQRFREDTMARMGSMSRLPDQPCSEIGRFGEEGSMREASYGKSLLSQLKKRKPNLN